MQPHTLKEFAQQLRLTGNYREVEFADEILTLIDLEIDVAEPYWELVGDIEHSAPADLKDKPGKALERLNDRSATLDEIETALRDAGKDELAKDTDDVVKALLGILSDAEDILETAGWPGDVDFITSLNELAERAARAPEEMEVTTYDL